MLAPIQPAPSAPAGRDSGTRDSGTRDSGTRDSGPFYSPAPAAAPSYPPPAAAPSYPPPSYQPPSYTPPTGVQAPPAAGAPVPGAPPPFRDQATAPGAAALPRPVDRAAAASAASPYPGPADPGPAAPRARVKGTGLDALAELEKLRKETFTPKNTASRPAVAATEPRSGKQEINRELRLLMSRVNFNRARRFSLTVQLEDAEHRPVDVARQLHVELDDVSSLEQLLLRLDIALQSSA